METGVLSEFWWRDLMERGYMKDLGVDGKIILKLIFKIWDGVDWIDLAQDMDGWQSLVNSVLNLRVP